MFQKLSIFIVLSFLAHCLQGQQKLVLENSDSGDAREILLVHSNAVSSLNFAKIATLAGPMYSSAMRGDLTMFDDSYVGVADFKGMYDISTPNRGIQLRANDSGGFLRFLTGGNNYVNNTRMLINNVGNIGIGTIQPQTKLHIDKGDIYLSEPSTGAILVSPDQSCWKVTVDNSGNLTTVSMVCP